MRITQNVKRTLTATMLCLGLAIVGCGEAEEDEEDEDTAGATTTTTTSGGVTQNVGDNTVTLTGSGTSSSSLALSSGSDPSELLIKVYSLAVSESGDCSDLIEVFTSDEATEVDFLDSPDLGSGGLDNGAYNCMAIEMSDNIRFTASETTTHCTAGTTYTLDVCQDHGNGAPSVKNLDGTDGECDSEDNKVVLYLSTWAAETNGGESSDANSWVPPTSDGDSENGFRLGAAWTVADDASSTFVVDASGKVGDSQYESECEMEAPTFTIE